VDKQTAEDRTVRADAPAAPEGSDARVSGLAAAVLAGAGVAWLGATVTVAHSSVLGNSDAPAVALGAAAFALPNLVAAALVAGAAVGLGATTVPVSRALGRIRLRTDSPVHRMAVGLGAGAVLGALCGGLVVWGYGTYAQVTALAVTVGIAALLGGAATALPGPVLASGLLATFGVLLLGLVAGFAQPGLIGLFGGGRTLDSQVTANWTLAYLVAILGGVGAGVLAFWFLRRHGPRPWPWYLLAGAVPGLALLITEVLTRTGGGALLDAVRGLSEGDEYTVDFTAFSRLRNAMVVFFVGGFAAMIAVGRTMRSADSSTGPGA
jgi:hypothetical protein